MLESILVLKIIGSVAALVSCYCVIIVSAVIVLRLWLLFFLVCFIVPSKSIELLMCEFTRGAIQWGE